MSNIDDIFKKGLDGKAGGLEYSDGHWAAMEQLLPNQTVGFFVRFKWMFGALALLLTSTVCLYLFAPNSTDNLTQVLAETTPVLAEKVDIKKTIAVENNINKGNQIEASGYKTTSDRASTQINVEPNSTNAPRMSSGENTELTYVSPPAIPETTMQNDNSTIENGSSKPLQSLSLPTDNVEIEYACQLIETELDPIPKLSSVSLKDIPWIMSNENKSSAKMKQSPYRSWSFYTIPYVGYVNYNRTINLGDALDENNQKLAEQSEGTINYGLNFSAQKGRWSISSGIGVLSLAEKTNYSTENIVTDYKIEKRIIDGEYDTTARGTRVVLVGDVAVDSTTTSSTEINCKDCEVKFNYVSVPLNVQYEIGNKRLRYFVGGGVTASFLQNAKGNYSVVNELMDSVSYLATMDLGNSEDVSKMLLQANASVGVRYLLTPKWNLWTSYGYGLGLNSMFGNYEHKPTIQNFRIGVEFKLK